MRVLLEQAELEYVAGLLDSSGELVWRQGVRRTLTGLRLKGLTRALADLLKQAYPLGYVRGQKSYSFELYGAGADEMLQDVLPYAATLQEAIALFLDARASLIGHVRRGRGTMLNGLHIAARREVGTLLQDTVAAARRSRA